MSELDEAVREINEAIEKGELADSTERAARTVLSGLKDQDVQTDAWRRSCKHAEAEVERLKAEVAEARDAVFGAGILVRKLADAEAANLSLIDRAKILEADLAAANELIHKYNVASYQKQKRLDAANERANRLGKQYGLMSDEHAKLQQALAEVVVICEQMGSPTDARDEAARLARKALRPAAPPEAKPENA